MNLQKESPAKEEAVTAWMNSDGHRQNILNSKFQEFSVGYYFLANDTGEVNYKHYWTQVLATQQ
ncbi:CAP domain-containing protein [Microcoleus sp. K1-B6]|uniref:CAP domain-containing protein n=1 Tax=unclassified Microcoleus TaxID=2642155 RepID=UPI002FD45792